MIQHIVLLKWKPDTTEEQILAAFRRAEHLPNEIDVPVDVALRAAPQRDWEYGASIGMGHLPDEP